MNLALLKGASLVGVFWGTFTAEEVDEHRANAAELYGMLESGAIAPRIAATFSLDEAQEGYRMLRDREVMGRVLVDVRS